MTKYFMTPPNHSSVQTSSSHLDTPSQDSAHTEGTNITVPDSGAKSDITKWKEINLNAIHTKALKVGDHIMKLKDLHMLSCEVCSHPIMRNIDLLKGHVCRDCSKIVHKKCLERFKDIKCVKHAGRIISDYQSSPMKEKINSLQGFTPETVYNTNADSRDELLSPNNSKLDPTSTESPPINSSKETPNHLQQDKHQDFHQKSDPANKNRPKSTNDNIKVPMCVVLKRSHHKFVPIKSSNYEQRCMVCNMYLIAYISPFQKCSICKNFCHTKCLGEQNIVKCHSRTGDTNIQLEVERKSHTNHGIDCYEILLLKFYDYEIKKRANTRFKLAVWLYDYTKKFNCEIGDLMVKNRIFLIREFLMPLNEIDLNIDVKILKSEINECCRVVVSIQLLDETSNMNFDSKLISKRDSFFKCFSFSIQQLENDNLDGSFSFLEIENGLLANIRTYPKEIDVQKLVSSPVFEDSHNLKVENDKKKSVHESVENAKQIELHEKQLKSKNQRKSKNVEDLLKESLDMKIKIDKSMQKNRFIKKTVQLKKRAASESQDDIVEVSSSNFIAIKNEKRKIDKLETKNFIDLQVIGKGSYGIVYKCYDNLMKRELALKFIHKPIQVNDDTYYDLMHELEINKKLTSDGPRNIMHLISAFTTSTHCIFVFPLQSFDLKEVIRQRKTINEDDLRIFLIEIGSALSFIHSHNIIYRDLKPENTMININGNIVLCDFGISKILNSPQDMTLSCTGTPLFMAPEMFLYKGYSMNVDWWAYGILAFICRANCYIFSVENERTFVQELSIKPPDFSRGEFSKELKSLIKHLLQKSPKKRLGFDNSFEKIKDHKFFDILRLKENSDELRTVPIEDVINKVKSKKKDGKLFRTFEDLNKAYVKYEQGNRNKIPIMPQFHYFNVENYYKR